MAVSGLALVLAGCASDAPPKTLIPAGTPVTSIEQLSGEYCYFGPDYNLRAFRRSPKMIPFVDVEAFGEPTKITVEASAQRIVFSFTDRDGNAAQSVFLPAKFHTAWLGSAFVVPWREVGPNAGMMVAVNVVGLLLGSNSLYTGDESRESRLFRLEDGRLVMTDSHRASGDLKPAGQSPGYWARQESVALLLDPAAGDCAAGPDHPPQPWFDEGVDLRNPACAAQLEEQVVSILIAKGEPPESARLAAQENVTALSESEASWAALSVWCPSGVTYGFRIGRKESGCVLRLVERTAKHRRTTWSPGSMPRLLPACDCN